LTDPALSKSLVQKGRERRRQFNWRQAADKTLEVWVEAAGMGLERQPGELVAQPTLEGGRV
jgi:hypothetical protein